MRYGTSRTSGGPNFLLRYARALGVLVLLALSTIGSTVVTGFATLAAHGMAPSCSC